MRFRYRRYSPDERSLNNDEFMSLEVVASRDFCVGFDIMTKEEMYMKMAIDLAWGGLGTVDPNPLVGAIAVKNDEIVAEGFHQEIGHFHAERNALTDCPVENTEGADLYVTLEPCCHTGKTPPCTDIIIDKKIKRVFVGAMDVNPLVAGKGVSILRDHGIEVYTGIL